MDQVSSFIPNAAALGCQKRKLGRNAAALGARSSSLWGRRWIIHEHRAIPCFPGRWSARWARLRCRLSAAEASSPVMKPAGSGDSFVLCARPSRQPGSPACDCRAALPSCHLQRFQVRSNRRVLGAGGAASGSSRSSAPSAAGELLRQHLRPPGQVSLHSVSSLLKELVLDSQQTLVGSVVCCGLPAHPVALLAEISSLVAAGWDTRGVASRHTRKCKYQLTCFVPLLQDKSTESIAEVVSAAPVS